MSLKAHGKNALLGNVCGKHIFPMIPNVEEEAVVYAYTALKRTGLVSLFYVERLVVTFDSRGIVSSVEFTENGPAKW